jgi:Domain of unknown function (DUF4268)
MYTKEEASAVRQKFWTSFGKYMQPVPSATGEKVNWINYNTGIKGIAFKMNADNNVAYAAIEIYLTNTNLQQQYFELFLNLKKQFVALAGNDWTFENRQENAEGKTQAIISTSLNNINIFRETDWPSIISFSKKNIIALDAFWVEYKVAFELIN